MKNKIFISGPMTGLPNFGRDSFWFAGSFFMNKKYEQLKDFAVITPAHLPGGLEQGEYMEICLPMVKVANCLIMLPGWEDSKGANAELALAKVYRHTVFEAQFSGYCAENDGFVNYPITDSIILNHPTNGAKDRMMLTILHAGCDGKPTLKDFRSNHELNNEL